jgi:hypothetical protein
MYIELPHDGIIEALTWLITRFKDIHQTTILNIKKYGRDGVSTGPSKKRGTFTVSLDLIAC